MTEHECAICAGMTEEEVLAADLDIIERHGWMIQYVSGPDPWAYTIGLSLRFAHPELVVTGLDYRRSMAVLNELGEQIRAGERLRPGPAWTTDELVELVEVHADQWATNLFAQWWNITDELGITLESEPRAVQVVTAASSAHRRLDQRPNRAARRAGTR